MMFMSNLVRFMLFVLMSFAIGQNQQSGNFSFEAPLLDKQDLPLIATLDFSKIDKELKSFISNTVHRVTDEEVKNEIQTEVDKRIAQIVPQIKDAVTESIRSDLREKTAFTASLTNTVVPVGNVKFDKVWLNTGNAYNPNTGIFTAPRNGRYLFSATIMASQDNGSVSCVLQKNDEKHLNIYGGKNFAAGTVNSVIALQKDDKVKIVRSGGKGLYGNQWSMFSGYFIGD